MSWNMDSNCDVSSYLYLIRCYITDYGLNGVVAWYTSIGHELSRKQPVEIRTGFLEGLVAWNQVPPYLFINYIGSFHHSMFDVLDVQSFSAWGRVTKAPVFNFAKIQYMSFETFWL